MDGSFNVEEENEMSEKVSKDAEVQLPTSPP
jgi:hypothetical protein